MDAVCVHDRRRGVEIIHESKVLALQVPGGIEGTATEDR